MGQLNINLTPAFEETLLRYMQVRGIRSKSEAVRIAIQEGLERSVADQPKVDFGSWLGSALGAGENPAPRFNSDDDLWGPP
jgi:hypothetical protein